MKLFTVRPLFSTVKVSCRTCKPEVDEEAALKSIIDEGEHASKATHTPVGWLKLAVIPCDTETGVFR